MMRYQYLHYASKIQQNASYTCSGLYQGYCTNFYVYVLRRRVRCVDMRDM